LVKAGIRGVKEASNGDVIPVMIHAATGGDVEKSNEFYSSFLAHNVQFDVIGLSYYPWWHGTFAELENNLSALSENFKQELSLVETAYYANNWYPEAGDWVLDVQPYPPTEQGQYDYMVHLLQILYKYPKVTSLYYWKPDGLDIADSGVSYLGRSLFSNNGQAFKGIRAWKQGED
jgi:arabinogalactan endo-1,4-beta-galactosidase